MANYKLSNEARDDLIRIYRYGAEKFGVKQADKYFFSFFDHFEMISKRPLSYESVDYIKPGYRRCVCGVDSIYFRVMNENIEIMAIIGRQDIKMII
ncbi:MAG: type II toxin-antitoxin system RelE/ParE family toxin [Bacteroidota bacterium]